MKKYIFIELKWRLLYILINYFINIFIILLYCEEFLYFFIKPSLFFLSSNFIFTELSEVFWVFYKLGIFGSFFCTIPFFLLQVLLLLIPGFYQKEVYLLKKTIFNIFCLILIFSYNFYIYFFPSFCKFFINFEQKGYLNLINIFYEGRLQEYLDLILNLFLCCIIFFCIVYFFFNWCLNIKIKSLFNILQKRSYIYLIFLFLNCFLISYDFFTLCFIMFLLIFFFEIIVFFILLKYCYRFNNIRKYLKILV